VQQDKPRRENKSRSRIHSHFATRPLPACFSATMSSKLLFASCAIAAVATARAEFVEPVVTGDVAFLETFSGGLGSWSGSKDAKYNGACFFVGRTDHGHGHETRTIYRTFRIYQRHVQAHHVCGHETVDDPRLGVEIRVDILNQITPMCSCATPIRPVLCSCTPTRTASFDLFPPSSF
jgi:hypothetical protein